MPQTPTVSSPSQASVASPKTEDLLGLVLGKAGAMASQQLQDDTPDAEMTGSELKNAKKRFERSMPHWIDPRTESQNKRHSLGAGL